MVGMDKGEGLVQSNVSSLGNKSNADKYKGKFAFFLKCQYQGHVKYLLG